MQPAAIQSAETLAALRALADTDTALATPCRDAFARLFLSSKNRFLLDVLPGGLLRKVLGVVAPGGYAFAIARTRHFDEALLNAVRAGASQVVILGAGYDSRAMRFAAELAGSRVFELDHPGTQARKKDLLARQGKTLPDNTTLIGIDFARQSLADALSAAGFAFDKPAVFLWEGVSYYLPARAVEAVLAFVAQCAPGSSIVFDYAIASFVDGDTSTYGGKETARWLKRIGEPFLFGLEPVRAPDYLLRLGLRPVSHLNPADLERLYLQNSKGVRLDRVLEHLRIIEAQTVSGNEPSP